MKQTQGVRATEGPPKDYGESVLHQIARRVEPVNAGTGYWNYTKAIFHLQDRLSRGEHLPDVLVYLVLSDLLEAGMKLEAHIYRMRNDGKEMDAPCGGFVG